MAKDQIMNLVKTKDYSKPEHGKKQSEENMIKQEDDYYKPTRTVNFWNNNYIEYESSTDRNKNLSFREYLDKIKPYSRDMTINLQKSSSWKIQLTIAINFISSKDVGEERAMHSKSDDIEFMSYYNANEVFNKVFESLLSRYQHGLERSMRGSDFTFDSVQLINLKRGGSYIDSPDWIKKKKATINSKNTDDKCFQYAATVALNYEEIESHLERVSSIKPFINKYNCQEINYPSNPAYISKHNSTREKQIILLTISKKEKEDWHYLAVKKLSALLHGIT